MNIDYEAIGKRIRKLRRERNMTQDDLRDLIDLSKSHMSHIETGTTKLSLPVLVEIANVLGVTADSLLMDNLQHSNYAFEKEINDILEDCTPYEFNVLVKSLTLVKDALRHYPGNK